MDVTPKKSQRAILVPDPGLTYAQFSGSLSTLGQAGPLPGVPAAEQDTDMVLQATGTQSASKLLRIHATKAGMPGPDEGGFVWRYGASEDRRGWEPPQTISEWEPIDWTNTGGKWKNPHAVTTSNGTVVVVVEKSSNSVHALVRNRSTGAWSDVTIYTHGTYTYIAGPTVVLLPSGRLLCLFWSEDATAGKNQVRMHYSDDDGATWTLGNKACLRTALTVGGTVTPRRLRAAYANQQLLLVAMVTDTSLTRYDIFVQYASDIGCNFSLVHTWLGTSDTTCGAYQDIVVRNGVFLFGYLRPNTSPEVTPYVRRIANAFELLASAEDVKLSPGSAWWGTYAAGAFSDGDLAFWQDDDGLLYAVGRNHNAAAGARKEIVISCSTNGGESFSDLGLSAAHGGRAHIYGQGDANRFPKEFCAIPVQGRSLLIHRFDASASGYGPSICAAFLGGYTQVNLPGLFGFPTILERVSWERTWLPFDLPNAAAMWTRTLTGAATEVISADGRLTLTSAAGESAYYEATPNASTLAEGLIAFGELRKNSGTGTVFLRTVIFAGGASHNVRLEVTATTIVLRDMQGAGSDIATATGVSGTTGVQLLVGLNNSTGAANAGNVQAWWRPAGTGSDRQWTLIGSSTTVRTAADPANLIRWGQTDAASSDWRIVQFVSDSTTGTQLTTWANPGDLFPRSFAPTPVYVDDGVKIAAKDGPCIMNEIWDVDTRYEHGIEYAHPDVSPSPARTWRSLDETQQDIVWAYALAQEHPPLSPSIGIGLFNINWRTGSLWGYDIDTAAYVLLANIDAASGQAALRWTRQGSRVVVDTGASNDADDYFPYNILEGSHFKLSGQEAVVRTIATNSEGAWTNSTTKRVRLELSDALVGDPTSGTAGEIWSKDVVVIVNNPTKYSRYRLRIDAQDTAEGYFRIGARVLGHVFFLARQYGRGRSLGWEPNADIVTHRSGARTVTSRGPTRRSASVQWPAADVSKIGKVKPTPDYVLAYTGATEPVGTPDDTPWSLAGLVEALDGATTPVVYLPRVDVQASAGAVITQVNRHRMLYARIVSGVQVQNILGNEADYPGEVLAIESVALEEEL